jgi:hypothetical protein
MSDLIITMPVMFDQQFYPGGFPIRFMDLHYNGESLKDIITEEVKNKYGD